MPKEYELRIFGSGQYEEKVQKAQQTHGNILYMGFQPHERVMEELRMATAMLFPSCVYEGFPMTISESFSVGCPVLSSNIGNQASLIRESCGGFMFDLKDQNSFISAIETIVKRRYQFSENARQYYETHLTPEEDYKRLIDIYDKAKRIQ